ncbi:MAG: hypothetical protein PHS41_06710 [Victivallaceae bacterium]|nr:hypothetical protein [Victivallaceae bacterium]
MRIEITSSPFKGANGIEIYQRLQARAIQLGFSLGVQFHNTVTQEELEMWRHHPEVPKSAHAPVLPDCHLNFAARECKTSFALLERNAELFCKFGIDSSVFHAFVMTDEAIAPIRSSRDYTTVLSKCVRSELLIPGSLLNRDFTELPEYRMRCERMKSNLAEVKRRFAGKVRFCIETDFPFLGYGSMFARDMAQWDFPVCLDTSHLWCTCGINHLDYQREVDAFFDTCDVMMLHFHASPFAADTPPDRFWDGHQNLFCPNTMNLPLVLRKALKHDCTHLVLEIPTVDERDLDVLASWL